MLLIELPRFVGPLTALSASGKLSLVVAAAILVGIAVTVRRLRARGQLTVAKASSSAAMAALVLATSLLITVSLNGASTAFATPAPVNGTTVAPDGPGAPQQQAPDGYQPIEIEFLNGYQLPTK